MSRCCSSIVALSLRELNSNAHLRQAMEEQHTEVDWNEMKSYRQTLRYLRRVAYADIKTKSAKSLKVYRNYVQAQICDCGQPASGLVRIDPDAKQAAILGAWCPSKEALLRQLKENYIPMCTACYRAFGNKLACDMAEKNKKKTERTQRKKPMADRTFGSELRAARLCYGWSQEHHAYVRITILQDGLHRIDVAPASGPTAKGTTGEDHVLWWESKHHLLSMIEPLTEVHAPTTESSFYVNDAGKEARKPCRQ